MKIKKIIFYIIFAFVILTPFYVNAAEVEYDFNFKTSKETMIDDDYLNEIKVCGYNAMINLSSYKSEHSVIEDYNEFYLNHGYFVARDGNNDYSIYYVLDSDYIEMSTFRVNTAYSTERMDNRFLMGVFYKYKATMNNNGQCTVTDYNRGKNFYSFVDPNVNNSDFIYDYHFTDLATTKTTLPDFYYPILGTNRNFKFVSVTSTVYSDPIKEFFDRCYLSVQTFRDLTIKSLNSKPGNVFRHPYSSEETEKKDTNKTSTVFSINSSNYSSLKLKYTISNKVERTWDDYLFMWKYDEKTTLDWLNLDVTASNSIPYPRRFTGYKKGKEIEYTKEANDFGSVVSSTKYKFNYTNLGGYRGAKEGYFYFDLSNLAENTIITIYLEYDPDYVEFESIELPATDLVEYDLTGKYAIGLVPKFVQSNNKFPLMYMGNFTTYYSFNANNFDVYDSENLNSTTYQKKILSFSNFSDTEKYEKPIFYMINNYYTDTTKTSKIKYNSKYFELLVYDTADSVVISSSNGFSYSSPSNDFKSNNSGINGSDSTTSSTSSVFTLTNAIKSLPDVIVGLSAAFVALGQCILIVFAGMPDVVVSVLTFSLLITVIVIVIKLK